MKLSTKGIYGMIAVIDLAIAQKEDAFIPLKTIAKRHRISLNYMEQLMDPLRKKGFIDGVRGPKGGYRLTVDPNKTMIKDVLQALEGSWAPVDCETMRQGKTCAQYDACTTRPVWEAIRDGIDELLDQISIEDLVRQYKSYQKRQVDLYHI